MSNAFKKAMELTMGHEGGYVNDPDDPGGETYRGISRRYFPTWLGWVLIDSYGSQNIELSSQLASLVDGFYRQQFWDRFQGSVLAGLNEDLPIEMFDQAVNLGVRRAVEHLQQACNILNQNEVITTDLIADGVMGAKTYQALKAFDVRMELVLVVNLMNILQGGYYIEKMIENPVKEKYRGWFKRVQLKRW